MAKPLILITNDDGINSPGLLAVAEAVLPLGEITVVAPSNQQTSMGRSLCGDPDDCLNEINLGIKGVTAYHCGCSPARVVLHAIDILYTGRKPDLIISGINYGENLGSNVTISGTIGAVIQGAAMGIPGLAVSLQTDIKSHRKHSEADWAAAKHFASLFASKMLSRMLPDDVDIVNVNIPSSATAKTPWKITRLSRQPYFANKIKSPNLLSKIGEGICITAFDEASLDPASDIYAIIKDCVVSVTPLSLDSTSRVELDMINKMFRI